MGSMTHCSHAEVGKEVRLGNRTTPILCGSHCSSQDGICIKASIYPYVGCNALFEGLLAHPGRKFLCPSEARGCLTDPKAHKDGNSPPT